MITCCSENIRDKFLSQNKVKLKTYLYSCEIHVECNLDGVLSVTVILSSKSILFIIISQRLSSFSDFKKVILKSKNRRDNYSRIDQDYRYFEAFLKCP